MTERKPDIITKWNIRKNTNNSNFEGEWVATCSAYPNIVICGDDPDKVQFAIKDALIKIYTETNYVDGGITGYTAEVGVHLKRDHTLDYFSANVSDSKQCMATDDPTPEPATDAQGRHSKYRLQLLRVQELSPMSDKTQVCGDCKFWSIDDKCHHGWCGIQSDSHDPTQEPATDAPELHDTDTDGEYEWKPIKELVAGCALCKNLGDWCNGNYAGEPCNSYQCRDTAGCTCKDCKRNMRIWNEEAQKYNKPFCTVHKADIENTDYCCYAYKEGKFDD